MSYTPGMLLGGMRVDLGPVRLGMVDSTGVAWRIGTEGLQGWDSPEVRAEVQQREADHGAWAAPVYLGERPVTLAGTITADGPAELDAAVEQLLQAVALTDTLLVVHETIAKRAVVHRSGKPMVQRVTDRIATWSVMVTAPDPRRYGTELLAAQTALPVQTGGLATPVTPPVTITVTTVAGSVAALNTGTFETRPVLTVDGPVSSPVITITPASGASVRLAYSQSLDTGDRLVIDTDARTVTLNQAVSRRRFLSVPGPWPALPPGETTEIAFSSGSYNPDARLTVTWRAAWI